MDSCKRFCFSVCPNPHSPVSASWMWGVHHRAVTWAGLVQVPPYWNSGPGMGIWSKQDHTVVLLGSEPFLGMLVSSAANNRLAQTGWFETRGIHSLIVEGLEVLNQGVGRAMFPLKSLGKNLFVTPPSVRSLLAILVFPGLGLHHPHLCLGHCRAVLPRSLCLSSPGSLPVCVSVSLLFFHQDTRHTGWEAHLLQYDLLTYILITATKTLFPNKVTSQSQIPRVGFPHISWEYTTAPTTLDERQLLPLTASSRPCKPAHSPEQSVFRSKRWRKTKKAKLNNMTNKISFWFKCI